VACSSMVFIPAVMKACNLVQKLSRGRQVHLQNNISVYFFKILIGTGAMSSVGVSDKCFHVQWMVATRCCKSSFGLWWVAAVHGVKGLGLPRGLGRPFGWYQSLLSTPGVLVYHCPFNDSSRRVEGGQSVVDTSQIDSKLMALSMRDICLLHTRSDNL
jgi:hypothetical protein